MKNGNGTVYGVTFTRHGSPSRLLNVSFFPTLAAAKAAVVEYRKDAKAKAHKNFGKKWDYAAVAITIQ